MKPALMVLGFFIIRAERERCRKAESDEIKKPPVSERLCMRFKNLNVCGVAQSPDFIVFALQS